MRLIDVDKLLEMGRARKIIEVVGNWKELPGYAKSACVRLGVAHKKMILDAPTVHAIPVTADELKHLINDTIAYIWRLEERGCDKPEFGYDSRKLLLEKLKQFEKEHFPEMECCCRERKENG